MPQFFIILIVFVVVMVGGMYGFSTLASKMVTRAIQDRLRALQQITEGQVPADWLKPFRKRVAALRRRAASDAQFARLGDRIEQRCLSRLDEMTRFTAKVNYADSEATQKDLIGLLKAYQQAWPAKNWRDWIAHVEALDMPSTMPDDDV